MSYIWRVECPDGKGAYRSGKLPRRYEWLINVDHQPGPAFDEQLGPVWIKMEKDGNHRKWSFGFANLAQCRTWFKLIADRRHMDQQGLILVKYRVDKQYRHKGRTQAIFVKDRATAVETRRIMAI